MPSMMVMNLSLKHILISGLILVSTELKAVDSLRFAGLGDIQTFAIDNKLNYFIADKANSLIKYGENQKEITRVNTKLNGKIFSIDCSNPFEIYVYHKEQNILVFYDNMLNHRGQMNFNSLGYENIACVSRSFDNGLWLFDYDEFEIKKLDKEGKLQLSSGNLINFTTAPLNPYAIVEHDNKVFLADSTAGILVFDLFGTYIKTIPILHTTAISFHNGVMISGTKNTLISYNLNTLEIQQMSISSCCLDALVYRKEGLYWSGKNFILRHSLS